MTHYPNLTGANTVGDFGGKLGKGERIALAMPDQIIATNKQGGVETNTIYIDVDDVTYATGGRWGHWANEGGSSLELIDPRANHRLPSNWADSDETGKAPWTNIEATDVLDNGADPPDNLQVVLLGEGECLLDNVEVSSSSGGTNRVTNPAFESGLIGWTPQGNHVRSTLETTSGYNSSQSLHIRASSRGDTGANRIWARLTSPLGLFQTAAIRAKVRWLHGWPEIVMRVHGNWMEATGRMTVPTNLGSPGAPNSRAVNNAGPAIYQAAHNPIVPAANEPVAVTARVHDPDGVSSVVLNYRLDPATNYSAVTMTDDGTGGDAIAGDGIFTAQIPGQAGGVVAFYVQAADSRGAIAAFPDDAPSRECLVRFNDPTPTMSFGVYRQWFAQKAITTWVNRPVLSNERVNGTFVYGNYRVIYNFGSRYAGSPYHQGFSSPLGSCHYSMEFPLDDLLLGTDNFNKVHAPGNGPFDDNSIQREQTCFWLVRKLGLPWLYRRYVAMFVNGSRRGTLMEDTQVPGNEMINEYFPDDADGFLYKLQPWFEFNTANSQQMGFNNNSWCTLNNYPGADGNKKLARYRWNYLSRAVNGSANNYTNVFALIDAANTSDPASLQSVADMEQWMRTFAVEHAVGNWDAFGCQNEQNMYGYKPVNGKWTLFIWDYNIVLGNSGSWGPGQELFTANFADGPMQQIYQTPPFRRAYWRALKELCKGPMLATNVNPVMDAKFAAFQASGVNVTTPSSLKSYLSSARTSILSRLAAADTTNFTASGPDTTATNLVALTGNAPVEVNILRVNGMAYPVTWTSVTNWSLNVPLSAARNTLAIQAYDIHGNLLSNYTATVSVQYTGAVEQPQDHIVINEIMYHPVVPDAEFVELHNHSTDFTFELSNYRINGLGYSFPEGVTMAPNSFVVLAKDRGVFAATYSGSIPIAGEFNAQLDNGGETLTLIKPGATPDQDLVVTRVRYDRDPPWPALADGTGASLQLIDPEHDNNRVGNWAAVDTNNVPPPQWKFVTVTGTASSSRLYVYLTSAGDVYLDDLILVAGDTPGVGQNLLRNGDFETVLTPPWNVSPNHAATAISTGVKHSGNAGLHLVATTGGTTATNSVWQDTMPLVNGQQYTLSYWYLPSANGNGLTIRLSGSGIVSTHSIQPAQTTLDPATPGAPNNVLASLPPFPPLWLNEVQADNLNTLADNAGDFDPWLELYNAGTNALALSGYFLSGNYSSLTQWAFPPDAVINAGQFLVVWLDGEPAEATATELHANFRPASGNGSVALSRLINNQPQVIDYLNYNQLSAGRSFGRYPDGQNGKVQPFDYPSPGATNNALSRPVTLWINEWMPANTRTLANPVGGKFDDWFELYNPGSNAVELTGYRLTTVLTNTTKFIIPTGKFIPSGGFLLVWADSSAGANNTNRSELHVNFKLNKDGEAIGLIAPDGTLIDAVTFGPQSNDVSQGRWPDGSGGGLYSFSRPTPGFSNVLPTSRYAPVLVPIGDKSVTLGSPLSFIVSATDADLPAQVLTFSLGANAPPGAGIDPAGGLFAWTPTAAQGTGVYIITVRVTDNGSPALSDEETIHVAVTNPGGLQITGATISSPGVITLNWQTEAGKTYQVQFKNDLNELLWQDAGDPITNYPSATFTDTTGTASVRFYRIIAF